MYEECDKSTLSQEQLRKIVKARWVVGDRPDPSTTTTTGVQPASELRARFVAKGYSQHVDDPMVDCYAATPSSASLKTVSHYCCLELYKSSDYMPRHIYSLHKHATTGDSRDLRTTTTKMVLQFTYNGWRLKKAMSRLHTSPKLWQLGEYYNNKAYDNAKQTRVCSLHLG